MAKYGEKDLKPEKTKELDKLECNPPEQREAPHRCPEIGLFGCPTSAGGYSARNKILVWPLPNAFSAECDSSFSLDRSHPGGRGAVSFGTQMPRVRITGADMPV